MPDRPDHRSRSVRRAARREPADERRGRDPLSWLLLTSAGLALLLAGCAGAPVVRWHSLMAPPAIDSPAAPAPAAAPVGNALAVTPPPSATPAAARVVDLVITRLPAQVGQTQWLVRLPDDTLRLLEEERWAAPLADELRAALMQALVARWSVTDAAVRPAEANAEAIRDALPEPALAQSAPAQPAPSQPAPARPAPAQSAPSQRAASAVPASRVTVDVTRFESLPDREARLDATWVVATDGPLLRVGQPAPAAPTLICRSSFREPVGAGAPALAAGHRRAVVALADSIGRVLKVGRGAVCPAVDDGAR